MAEGGKICSKCGRAYDKHSGRLCGACRSPIEHHTKAEAAEC